MKSNFEEWEKEVKAGYGKKEYQGVFESVLHLDMSLTYMRSEEGKKVLTEELGELKYLEDVRLQERSLKLRTAELEVLRNTIKYESFCWL